MIDLNDLFNRTVRRDSYQRIDADHLLDLYIGLDEMYRWALLLICNVRPPKMTSSKMILAKVGQREDGRWSVSLSLIKQEYKDIFLLMLGDIIESSRPIKNKDKAARFVVARYMEWREMFANSRCDLLSPEEIKGLLGEMYILDSELMKKYGSEKSALSWTGPKAGHQDFVLEDTWYEVKTISSGKDEVKISSVEQLDCSTDGILVVVYADRTSRTNERALNLNLVYMKLLAQLRDDDVKEKFCDMLLRYGYYPRPEYEEEEYTFEIKGVSHYKVQESFPCFRRKNIPPDITKVDYYISLPAISGFKEE